MRTITYDERGTLEQGGAADLPFTQTHKYTHTLTRPAVADVAFRDGRFFHSLDLSAGTCAVVHACDPDTYRGTVTALSPTALRFVWRVTGPRKDFTITTDLTREE